MLIDHKHTSVFFQAVSSSSWWMDFGSSWSTSWEWKRKGRMIISTWPAISDIWLGIRTVPVLSVAKESRGASQIAHWPRSARTVTGRSMRTDWSKIEWQETFEFCPFVDVSVSSRRIHRAWDACRVFKADVLRESKKSAWFPSSEIDDRSWPLSVIVRVLRGRVRLGKRGKIGRRRRIHTEKTKTITIIDRRIRIHTCTSRWVKVKSTFGGPPCVAIDPAPVHMVALQVGTQLICWPSEGLQLGWSTVLPPAVGSWATIQGPCNRPFA